MKGDYKNARIYKIEPMCDHEDNEIYFGSTSQKLCKRMDKHRTGYKLWKKGKTGKIMVFDLFDKYGLENCKIYLVEDYPCERKEQLEKREGEIIKANKCINKYVAGRTYKQYCIDNKQKMKDKMKRYYTKNKDKVQKYHKEHYLQNKNQISEKKKIKFHCECGISCSHNHKARHNKSLKHKKYQKKIDQLAALNKMHNEIIQKHKQLYF